MTDQKWSALAKKIEPSWGPERDRLARVGLERRALKRRTATRALASVAALALVASGANAFVHLRTHTPSETAALAPAPSAGPPAETVEAVLVTPLSTDTVLEPIPEHHGRGFALRSGGARFTRAA